MRENGQAIDNRVFEEYINLDKRYRKDAFENLAKGAGGNSGELRRFFRGNDYSII